MTSLFCRMSDRILDSITEGVFTVGQDMKINYFNRSAEKITGVNREDAIGRKCFNVFRANICQSACILKQSIETGREIVNRKVNIINSKGCTVPITIRTSVL
ncbi:MAG: PAS domain-containing protein, partial [Desulfurivibrionaceae bacterium]|nr:PAS domain-containing protein [Desulfurivibrionaceae bacterium]